jgi:hypothetical protein
MYAIPSIATKQQTNPISMDTKFTYHSSDIEAGVQRKGTDAVAAQGAEDASLKALPGPSRFWASLRLEL